MTTRWMAVVLLFAAATARAASTDPTVTPGATDLTKACATAVLCSEQLNAGPCVKFGRFDFVDGDVTAGDETIAENGHGFETGDGPVRLSSTDTLPGALSNSTDYWVIRDTANAIKLAASAADAEDGTAVNITADAGVGTHTLTGPTLVWDAGSRAEHTLCATPDTAATAFTCNLFFGSAYDAAKKTQGTFAGVSNTQRCTHYEGLLPAAWVECSAINGRVDVELRSCPRSR